MAIIRNEISRTFEEFLLTPRLTKKEHTPDNVSLKTSLVKFGHGEKESPITLDNPLTSAMMQSVSGEKLAVALAKEGGMGFIYCSQPIDKQAKMVKAVKDQNLRVGAGINTRDYKQRIPALVDAGTDCLCIDSSDGFSEWQADVLQHVRKEYDDNVKIGAGNIVSAEAFKYLVDNGADFIKVGIGGGSICITRKQKAIGMGQASALHDVVTARDEYQKENGIYVPICSDGGIVTDSDLIMAFAFGADTVMMGRYFARSTEAPGDLFEMDGIQHKEYWGEGSNRARLQGDKMALARYYDVGDDNKQTFEEGVNGSVPHAGKLGGFVGKTLHKLKSTMCNCGALTLRQFTDNAIITLISDATFREGDAHDVVTR